MKQFVSTSCGIEAHRKREAFTLVELLVVIGIMAALIAILMPALSRARAQALMMKCCSNQRQIMTAMVMYVNDNRGVVCPVVASDTPGGASPWYTYQFLAKYIGEDPKKYGVATTTAGVGSIFQCPALRNPNTITGRVYFDSGVGIGMNACYDNNFLATSLKSARFKLSWAKDPTKQLMFVDVNNDTANYNYYFEQFFFNDGAPRSWSGSGGGSCRSVAYRHSSRTVVAFADGHVETFKSDDPNGTNQNTGLDAARISGAVQYKWPKH